jgi:hypothetical protein
MLLGRPHASRLVPLIPYFVAGMNAKDGLAWIVVTVENARARLATFCIGIPRKWTWGPFGSCRSGKRIRSMWELGAYAERFFLTESSDDAV